MILRRLLFSVLAAAFSLAAVAPAVRAQDDSLSTEEAKPKKKKPAKKKGFDYDRSKYKSLEPSPTNHYRFNEKGEPVSSDKKKAAAKKKKRSEPPEEEAKSEACGSEGSCLEKKSDADAL